MKTLMRPSWIVLLCVASLVQQTADAQRSILKQMEDAFVELSEEVRPSVVEITAEGVLPSRDTIRQNDLFRFFGQPRPDGGNSDRPPTAPLPKSRATASGFIYDHLGHIVTNNHVVKDSTRLVVTLADGQELEAEIVGLDPGADLAVIKIDPSGLDLKPVRLGNSSNLKVGQLAIAMGSPNGLTGSFSYGHVTGLGRESLQLDRNLRFQNFIQTDAAINLGNSGGPLCNIDGEVIGVSIAIVYRANSIGFAIPIDRVKSVVPQLIASGKVVRGWLGVGIDPVARAAKKAKLELEEYMDAYNLPDERGTFVQSLTPGGPGERAGLQEDDVIRELNGKSIMDPTDLINSISEMRPGTVAKLGVWRKGAPIQVDVVIDEFPGLSAALFGRAYFGMYVSEPGLTERGLKQLGVDENPPEFWVVEVEKGSPAEAAGIEIQDIIIEVAHKDTTTLKDFKSVLKENGLPGKTLLLKVLRPRRGAELLEIFIKIPEDYEIN